ncbi:hypothetical protein HNY73_007280 [Argiope bruennichi]|uniref:Uncharacterized protein n=1 Tax=Argiope bruennichi TaxID=94029 RepID=A0A8T0FII5_ARGBR|nr:hypothetical protein HNY73_007280 [Argiope bruennichi]
MQKNHLTDFESRLIQTRVRGLALRLCNMKKRFQYLAHKYEVERRRLDALNGKLKDLSEKIDGICNFMLTIKLNSTDKTDAVIIAVLENMFAEKKILHDLFLNFDATYVDIEKCFDQFQINLSLIFHDDLSPETVSLAESLLMHLPSQVVSINEMASRIHEKSFQFICTFEETLAKIKIISKKVAKCDTQLDLMTALFIL